MAHDFDKILKENIAEVILPLSEKYLGIKIVKTEELKDKIQTTIEKEPDFIRIVETETQERFILHLEFQSQDESAMIYRMQEYFSILRRKYKLRVRQFVLYLGEETSKVQTELTQEEIFTGFTLKQLQGFSYKELLTSDIPEEIILAILSDFEGIPPLEMIRKILERLQQYSMDEISLRKYIRQLATFARLRNLSKETKKQVQDMGLLYNIEEDAYYQEGIEKGIEKGKKETKLQVIQKMLEDKSFSVTKIALLMEVGVEYVKQIAQELKKKKK
jgi:hypothetical protein